MTQLQTREGAATMPLNNSTFIEVENIPPELHDLKQWVIWKAEDRGGEKLSKVPYCPLEPIKNIYSAKERLWAGFCPIVKVGN